MPLIIAIWPNATTSILKMHLGYSMLDLFEELDQEAGPLAARCYEARACNGLHITFDMHDMDEDGNTLDEKRLDIDALHGSVRSLEWPEDIIDQYYAKLRSERPRPLTTGEREAVASVLRLD
jgi:hypothetical protein